MATSNPLEAAVSPTPAMPSWERILAVFSSPRAAFQAIARDPHFLLCWAVQIAAAVGYWFYLLHRLGAAALARQSLLQSATGRAMDAATLQKAVSASAGFYQYLPYIVGIAVVAMALLLGWLFQGVSNLLLGLEARYKAVLAMVSHAMLPTILLAGLSALVLALTSDLSRFQYVNPVGSNLAFYLDKASVPAFLYAVGTHLDLFSLWTVLLLALGISRLDGARVKFSTAFWTVFSLWIFYALAAGGLTAAFA